MIQQRPKLDRIDSICHRCQVSYTIESKPVFCDFGFDRIFEARSIIGIQHFTFRRQLEIFSLQEIYTKPVCGGETRLVLTIHNRTSTTMLIKVSLRLLMRMRVLKTDEKNHIIAV